MARKAPRRTVILGALLLLLLVVVFAVNYYYAADAVTRSRDFQSNVPLADNTNTSSSRITHSPDATADNEALRYIPHTTLQTWSERDYLIVFGIPSVDIASRRSRRSLQRSTCWQFPGVARRANNFTGDMLVLYVLARHPSHGYRYSAALLKEVEAYHDVITLPMNEGRPSTKNLEYSSSSWGLEAQIALSRKVFLWFDLALRLFPRIRYITKADDDVFVRVPQFLSDLRLLPLRGIYWGRAFPALVRRGNVSVKFRYTSGMCYTLSRDVAKHFVSYEPLRRLVHLPYSKEREKDFVSLNMSFEDVMVGRILLVESRYTPLFFVAEYPCRFPIIHNGSVSSMESAMFVVVHQQGEDEYALLMDMFGNGTTYMPGVRYFPRRKYIKFVC
ncbi:Glycosyl transferase [Trypanosoma melophagium]|uniref:Glycosyl transferase n=1 Tax=Trypanosoma melophagium TaxID=715481 RepID=UPI003519E894|nr:Glycosyl transferase [Trypanosoma melophagium]